MFKNESHNRIIIPDFGAFIISRDNGHHILFNNFLTFNDGLLVSHICEAEGLNSDQALEKVKQFIEKINLAFAKDGYYKIDEIGTLIRSDEGSISFEPEEIIEESQEEPIAKNEEEKKEEDRITLVDNNELLDLDTSQPISDKKIKPEEAATPPPLKPKEEAPTPTPTNTETFIQPPPTLIVQDHRKTKLPNWFWLLLILLLLLIGVAVIFFFTNIPEKAQECWNSRGDQSEFVEEEIAEPVLTPLPIDSSALEKDIESKEKEESLSKVTRQHHVIVATFKNKEDALSLKTKLISQGLKATSILEYEGKYLVSTNWYSSVSPALRRQEELLKTHRLENWVLSIDAQ